MENNAFTQDERTSEEPVELQEDIKVACDECGMIGSMTQFVQGIDDEQGTIHFQVLEMDECGHGFVTGVRDPDLVSPAIEKVSKLTKRAMMLQGSEDITGMERTVKKIQAVKIEVQDKMRTLWRNRAHKISKWPASPKLAGNDDSSG